MLIKFVSLTSQSITKFVNTDVQRRVSVYFGGNIFNIKLTIVAAQKLLYCQFSALYTQFRLTPAKKAFNDLKGFHPHPSAKVSFSKSRNIEYMR